MDDQDGLLSSPGQQDEMLARWTLSTNLRSTLFNTGTDLLTDPLTHSHTLLVSDTQHTHTSLTYKLRSLTLHTHSPELLLTHSLTSLGLTHSGHSLTHSLTHSHTHSLTHSLTHTSTDTPIHTHACCLTVVVSSINRMRISN